MAYEECVNGHIYDTDMYNGCPYCSNGANQMVFGAKRNVPSFDDGSTIGKTMPVGPGRDDSGIGETVAPGGYFGELNTDDSEIGKTTPLAMEETEVPTKASRNIIAGWLMCIDGPEQGRDYRVFARKNTMGRGSNMDISIRSDLTISRNTHATLEYDEVSREFYITPGNSANKVYVNGELVESETRIDLYQVIELGKTKLVFVPLCGEYFDWNDWIE